MLVSTEKYVYSSPLLYLSVPLFCVSQLHTAVNNFCECALYLRCWVIAYSSVCAFESLIISMNYSGYESIMSHIEECSQCVVAVAFTLTRDSLRKAEVALLHSVNLIGLQVRSEKKKVF